MKIGNGGGPHVPIGQKNPMVDEIMEAQKIPLERAERNRAKIVDEKNEYASLGNLLTGLQKASDGLSLPSLFNKFKAESSHPDILDAAISGAVSPGSYDFEVRGLAQAEKHLAYGFPDRNETPVGLGFMSIETDSGELLDVTIEPGSTLNDVVSTINGVTEDYKAQIVNTGSPEDPFRLLVSSVKTGKSSAIRIDEDTSFLEFKNIKKGRDLDVMFEDVAVTGAKNELNELLDGININLKRAEPGTKVSLTIKEDIDTSMEGIKQFTEGYNKIIKYANGSAVGEDGKPMGLSRSNSDSRSIVRRLQSTITSPSGKGGGFKSLAQVGITTNAKTGSLEINEQKLKSALTKDYGQVMELFSETESGSGVAKNLSNVVKGFMSHDGGIIKSHNKTLDRRISDQNKEIDRQTRNLERKRIQVERTFAALDSNMATMNSQSQFLTARFGQQSSG